jgi:dsRNA-specific ribonuclease
MANSRSTLSEKHQRVFREPLELRVKNKTGPDHHPKITVEYITHWGIYTKTGDPGENQKTVAEKLATEILMQTV